MSGPKRYRLDPKPVDRDTYRHGKKLPGGTRCPECGLVVERGRWIRPVSGAPEQGPRKLCPACERIRDRYPAGVIDLTGDLGDLGPELLNLLRNVETVERDEHPLERLIELELGPDGLRASTTGAHLARRIGSALERRLGGRIEIRYGEEENLVRIEGSV